MILRFANLALLVLFPIAWFAPLLRAAMLPIFGLNEISIISWLQSLWRTDVFLALIVTAFAIFAPYLKTIGLALVQFRLLDARTLPFLSYLGKLAMADIFLIALYVVVVKGVSRTHVEGAWGLYLFTACVLGSIVISIFTSRRGGLSAPHTAGSRGGPAPHTPRGYLNPKEAGD